MARNLCEAVVLDDESNEITGYYWYLMPYEAALDEAVQRAYEDGIERFYKIQLFAYDENDNRILVAEACNGQYQFYTE